ncbi:MAG TPA: cyclic lactone autoinducer peptide [Clostridiaceae bacterium]|nr:cyclic lactone autoinducer peptide [Clostridiaceae bacterium]
MKSKVLRIVGALLTLAALFTASSACSFIIHQPKEPKCLRK